MILFRLGNIALIGLGGYLLLEFMPWWVASIAAFALYNVVVECVSYYRDRHHGLYSAILFSLITASLMLWYLPAWNAGAILTLACALALTGNIEDRLEHLANMPDFVRDSRLMFAGAFALLQVAVIAYAKFFDMSLMDALQLVLAFAFGLGIIVPLQTLRKADPAWFGRKPIATEPIYIEN